MEKPKKPDSPYLIWFKENRLRVKLEHQLKSYEDVSKKCRELWKEVLDKSEWQSRSTGKKIMFTHTVSVLLKGHWVLY